MWVKYIPSVVQGMKSDDDIISEFTKRVMQSIDAQRNWRDIIVYPSYQMYDGNQYSASELQKFEADDIIPRTINKCAPLVDAVSGFEIQNRGEVKYIPRLTDEESEGFTDVVSKGAKYIEEDSFDSFESSQAFNDMLICGVGATQTYISYDENPDGETENVRPFPWLLLWDAASKRKNLVDRNWNAVAQVVDTSVLEEYLNDRDDDEGTYQPYEPLSKGFGIDSEFLRLYYNNARGDMSLSVMYEYEWREKEAFYRVQNPFKVFANDPMVMQYLQENVERFSIRPDDDIFNMEHKEFREFKAELKELGIPLEYTKQKKYKYYRALLGGGRVLEKSLNFSQQEFGLQFMTGKFSEVMQMHYGLLRAMSDPQKMLNSAVSNYETYLRSLPNGGFFMEADAAAGGDIEGFLATIGKARDITLLAKDAIKNQKILPKPLATPNTALVEMINMALSLIPESAGIDQSFLGMTDSKDMTGVLFGQKIRQALTTLAAYFDAKRFFTISKGRLFIDCVRIMAENNPSRLIRDVTGKGSAKFIPLLKDGIAAEYDVTIEEVPQSPSERQETFAKLLDMAGQLVGQGVNIMPLVVKYAPLPPEEKAAVEEAMVPPPPPQPDPVNQGLLVAETNYKNAMAEKAMAEAQSKQQEISNTGEKLKVEIEEIVSQTILNLAKAGQSGQASQGSNNNVR